MAGERLRFYGLVQGVGFRPTAARVARRLGLSGWVRNDAGGVEVALAAPVDAVEAFLADLAQQLPELATIERVERRADVTLRATGGFEVLESADAVKRSVAVTPDAVTCSLCRAEVLDPQQRRFRYPFATCTHCGPRYSIVVAVPYDRPNTTMAAFPLCDRCRAEYEDEGDRRYHAQPIACSACGPQVALRRADGRAFGAPATDEVDAVGALLLAGEIVAIKGLGGYQLCCDATNEAVVSELRARKRRPDQPFALMVRDLDVARRYASLSQHDEAVLQSSAGPIVLLSRRAVCVEQVVPIALNVAPGQSCIGLMLPTTPLHHLMLMRLDRPIVCTSGNVHDEPQCIDDAVKRLGAVADWFLEHDRPIAHRVDDSVVRRMAGAPRVLRRARGYAPTWLPLPGGGDSILAMGGHYKSTFALGQDGRALLSPHLGDLDGFEAFAAYKETLSSLSRLYGHEPSAIAIDMHSGYRTAELGRQLADERGLPLIEVQHHHAHIASCLAENGWRPSDQDPHALGLALDGLGMGADGELWGGELLLCSYADFQRVGTLKPVALLGGDKASREPWRSLYAHLVSEMGWEELTGRFGNLEVVSFLKSKPCELLDGMLVSGTYAPLASSCGRLFDAVAAALALHREEITFEGQAAMALEACVTTDALAEARAGERYPSTTSNTRGMAYVEPVSIWRALLSDLAAHVPTSLIAARFHLALAASLGALVDRAREDHRVRTIALSGGCFQNAVLLELVIDEMQKRELTVMTHRVVPPNDACIAYGQAAIASVVGSNVGDRAQT